MPPRLLVLPAVLRLRRPGTGGRRTEDGTSEQVWTGRTGRLLDEADIDVVERDGTAFVSDYLGDAVRVVRLDE